MNSPILPTIDRETYEADRAAEAVNVLRSEPRIVQIGPFKFRAIAEDWGSSKACEEAASMLAVMLNTQAADFKDQVVTDVLDALADRIMGELRIPADRMLGCAFIVEPL